MNFFAKTFHYLAMTYCHYVGLRVHFRAVILASVKEKKLLTVISCPEQPLEQV